MAGVVQLQGSASRPGLAKANLDSIESQLSAASECDRIDLLYRTYARRIRALSGRRLGQTGDADDAVQETLLKAARAWPSFRPGCDPWPWLARIATNVCHDMARAGVRHAALQMTVECVPVDDIVAASMRADMVHAALRELAEPMRSTLVLRELEGWSYEEIATLQGRSLAAVRTTIMRGRRSVRDALLRLADSGRIPLPAFVPGLSHRVRAAASRSSTALARLDLAATIGMTVPARIALVAVILASGGGGWAAFHSSAADAAAVSRTPGAAALALVGSPRQTPAQADPSGGGRGVADTPKSGVRVAAVTVSATSPDGSLVGPSAGADVHRPTNGETLSGKITGRVAPGIDVDGSERANLDCDYSPTRRQLCDSVDTIPAQP